MTNKAEDPSEKKLLKTIYEMIIFEITKSAMERLGICQDFVSEYNEIGVIFNESDKPTILNIVCLKTHKFFFDGESHSNVIDVVNSKEEDGIIIIEDQVLQERYPGYF